MRLLIALITVNLVRLAQSGLEAAAGSHSLLGLEVTPGIAASLSFLNTLATL